METEPAKSPNTLSNPIKHLEHHLYSMACSTLPMLSSAPRNNPCHTSCVSLQRGPHADTQKLTAWREPRTEVPVVIKMAGNPASLPRHASYSPSLPFSSHHQSPSLESPRPTQDNHPTKSGTKEPRTDDPSPCQALTSSPRTRIGTPLLAMTRRVLPCTVTGLRKRSPGPSESESIVN